MPKEEWLNGWAESIKHALIKDTSLLEKIKKQIIFNPNYISIELLQSICQIKIDIVAIDPKEQHIRKALNFGHTVGHALESFFLINGAPVPYGLAVAAGMIIESDISQKTNNFEQFDIVREVLKQFPKIKFELKDSATISKLALKDKKNVNGSINMTTLTAIGQFQIDTVVPLSTIQSALENYCNHEQ